MNFLRRLFRRNPQTFPAPDITAIIAARAVRVCNRSGRLVPIYKRTNTILASGRRG